MTKAGEAAVDDQEPQGSCVVCRARDPVFELGAVCGPCRSRFLRMLREIPDLCVELAGLGYVQRDRRPGTRAVLDEEGRIVREPGHVADPVANVLTAGPILGVRQEPRVSGTQERGVPARLDLLAPADTRSVADVHGDQVGAGSVATVLRAWVCAWWEDHRGPRFGERLPDHTDVHSSARWLRDRVEWACDELESVRDFDAEVSEQHLLLRRALGLTEPKPERCVGLPCKRCELKLLMRLAGSDWVECEECGALLSEQEYLDWLRLNTAALCGLPTGHPWRRCRLAKRHEGPCEPMTDEDTESVAPAA